MVMGTKIHRIILYSGGGPMDFHGPFSAGAVDVAHG